MARPGKTHYHHGDLRRAVLDASLALVDEEGVGALSMREVARRAGVSHGAPYHHFPDRAAILAAIAADGFELLGRELLAARDGAGGAPDAQFRACGVAYFDFALRHPSHFRVMFRPELSVPEQYPAVDQASAAAFQILVEVVRDCQAAGLAPDGDPLPLAVTGWSSAHGLAALWLDGPLARGVPGLPSSAAALAATVAETLRALMVAGGAGRADRKNATRSTRGGAARKPSSRRAPRR